jgi:hypothetical protein
VTAVLDEVVVFECPAPLSRRDVECEVIALDALDLDMKRPAIAAELEVMWAGLSRYAVTRLR